jgi:hypothetical protein
MYPDGSWWLWSSEFIAENNSSCYGHCVNRFTRQEQTMLGVIVALLLIGMAAKAWRLSMPRTTGHGAQTHAAN